MPPNMIITPEASDSANAADDTLLSVVADAISEILPPSIYRPRMQCIALQRF